MHCTIFGVCVQVTNKNTLKRKNAFYIIYKMIYRVLHKNDNAIPLLNGFFFRGSRSRVSGPLLGVYKIY